MQGDRFTPIPVVAVRTPATEQWLTPPGLWVPAAAMAASLLVGATAGITLGVLATFQVGFARDRWPATVQAHGELQLWAWFAVFIVALLFEFIVRLSGRPAVPLRPRVIVLSLLGGGALMSSAGRFLDAAPGLVTGGAASMAIGALLLAVIVMRIRPAHPYRVDLHPLFFRAGAAWLLLAAVAGLLASRTVASGAVPFDEAHVVAELFLRGFVMNVTFAVALRAFVGHLGLPPVPVGRQRVLWGLVNVSIVVWVSGTTGFGLPGAPALAAVGDLLFAAGMLWATWALGIGRAARSWRRPLHRAQILVPVAWIGLVAYSVTLAGQAAAVLGGGVDLTIYQAGATRHVLMLGFVAPLLIAMTHVALERFLIGRLSWEAWLTAAFVLLVVAWPMRALPPLVDGSIGDVTRGLMGTAGVLTAAALLIAAAVATQNAIAAERYVRLLRRVEGTRTEQTIPMVGLTAGGSPAPEVAEAQKGNGHMHEIDVRADIAAGREPFPRIMAAVKALAPGDELLLIAPFEPAPLYAVLAEQGLDHEAEAQDDGAWHVTIRRPGPAAN
jgi:uncharacterized protein (DUF2249 family)